jgi:hypothetical protein
VIMPQRAMSTIMVVAGCALALVFVLVGADLAASAQRGPRWRRRLLGAGLVMLVALGLAPTAPTQAATSPAAAAAPAKESLAENTLWKRVMAAWQEAEEVASGKRGDYPFDEKGKKALLESLAASDADLLSLSEKGVLAATEAGLLNEGLKGLVAGVQAKRPTEMKDATCYKPMVVIPAQESAERLKVRFPLVQKLSAAETLHPEAVRVIMVTLEKDLAQLNEPGAIEKIREPKVQTEARDIAEAARREIDAVRLRLNPKVSLEETPQWKNLVALSREVDKLGKDLGVAAATGLCTRCQSAELDLWLLVKHGALTEPEGRFLMSWCNEMNDKVIEASRKARDAEAAAAKGPPVMCYAPMPSEAQQDLMRLKSRLPILEKVAAEGLHPAALRKIIERADADLAEMEKNAGKLQAAEKGEASKAMDAMKTSVERLRKYLALPEPR